MVSYKCLCKSVEGKCLSSVSGVDLANLREIPSCKYDGNEDDCELRVKVYGLSGLSLPDLIEEENLKLE